MDNGQAKFEKIVQELFKLQAPGCTYNIVEAYSDTTTRVVQVIELPEHHESYFSSKDIEYQFWTLVSLKSQQTSYGPYVFRKLVDDVLYNFEYSKEVAFALAIMYALIIKLPEYTEEYGYQPISQKQFVEEYLQNG